MPYELKKIKDSRVTAVFHKGEKIGVCRKNLLILDPEYSAAEWLAVTNYLANKPLYNGKLDRKKTGFHHSYEILDGVPYRVSHSLKPIDLFNRRIREQGYDHRGYLGYGRSANAKIVTNESGQSFALHIRGLSDAEYNKLLGAGESQEARALREEGRFVREYLRETKSGKIWRLRDPALQKIHYKKITLTTLLPGQCSFDFIERLMTKGISLTEKEQCYFSLLLLSEAARYFYSGKLNRDIKPENFNIDLENLRAGFCDLEFSVNLPLDMDYLEINSSCGSKAYLPPEILLNNYPVRYSEKSEIYACGVILRHIVAGEMAEYVDQKLCPYIDSLQDFLNNKRSYIINRGRLSAMKESVKERATFLEAIKFFQGKLSKCVNDEIRDMHLAIQHKKSKLKPTYSRSDALAKNYLMMAHSCHFLDYRQAVAYAQLAMDAASTSKMQKTACGAFVDYSIRHADWQFIHPDNYQKAITSLEESLEFINSHPGYSFSVEQKKQIENKWRHLKRQVSLYYARILVDKRPILAAEYLSIASEHSSDWMDKVYLLEDAIRLSPESQKVGRRSKLASIYSEQGKRFEQDGDFQAALYCLKKFNEYREEGVMEKAFTDYQNDAPARTTLMQFERLQPSDILTPQEEGENATPSTAFSFSLVPF